MEARAGGAGHWRRWNGAEWNRLELAKSGPSPADVSLEAASGDSSAVQGWQGRTALDCVGYFLEANYRQIVADEAGDEEKSAGQAILNLF